MWEAVQGSVELKVRHLADTGGEAANTGSSEWSQEIARAGGAQLCVEMAEERTVAGQSQGAQT